MGKADPLPCPQCSGRMRLISFIEEKKVIKRILKHLGLRAAKARPLPRKTKAPLECIEPYIDYCDSELLGSDNHLYLDPAYTTDYFA
ncbi:MAG: hypothetical protein JSW12_02370 [Deltaproteobacteria bacterium]|nr:MAG: hypothetical protein JSW12_02370 [Deltaproteobacteria bacterium]